MRITILGTCSGTEPVPGRHHTSFTVETGGRLYWFDAGESCSYTGHLAGLDLPATEAVFISHTDMDHIGGLPNLLWTLRKLAACDAAAARRLAGREIRVFIPNLAVFEGVLGVLRGTEGGFRTNFRLKARRCRDGLLYDENGLRVIARHNLHLGGGRPHRSFSFRVEAGGKSVVYSGDVRGVADFEALISPCDLLLMETGHHRVEDVCARLADRGADFGRLVFIHHGRAVLADPSGEEAKARARLGDRVTVADDGQALDL